MSDINWPTTGRAFTQFNWDEGLAFDVQITIARAGNLSTRMLPGWRWVATLGVPDESVVYRRDRQALEALLARMRGGVNRLAMYNPAKVLPAGTLRGSPTVASPGAVKGASSIALTNCNGSLFAGDLIGLAGQRVMVSQDTDPVGGAMTVPFEPPLRGNVGAGTAVVYDRPRSLFVPQEPTLMLPYRGTEFPGFSVALIEGWT